MKGQDFAARTAALDELLGVGRSFDMVGRSLRIGGKQAKLWVVNGYAEDQMLERLIAVWLKIKDLKDRPLLLFVNSWSIRMVLERNEGLVLSEFGRS